MTTDRPNMRREPIMWLVWGLPAAAVAASVALIFSAIESGGSDAITDRVDETGDVHVADLGPDMRAQRLGLSAVVRIQDGKLEVFPVNGNFDHAATLRVSLQHPIQAGLDLGRTLRPNDLGWSVAAAPDLSHDWNVQLASENGDWRIQGRLPKGQHAVYLKPAFGTQ